MCAHAVYDFTLVDASPYEHCRSKYANAIVVVLTRTNGFPTAEFVEHPERKNQKVQTFRYLIQHSLGIFYLFIF